MAAVEGDPYGQDRLGILESPAEDRLIEATPALEHLSTFGLVAPRRGVRNAVSLALVHISYHYEARDALPGITRGTLEALDRLGGAFVQKVAAADSYRNSAKPTSGSMSKDVAQIRTTFREWTSQQDWISKSAALSVGLDRRALPLNVTASLCRQVLGVLCLEGAEDVAQALLADHAATQRRKMSQIISDAKTVLQEHLGRDTITYEYRREGPDHSAVFHAVVMDARQRRGAGTGRSKKAAAQQAALDFLQKYVPGAFASEGETVTRRLPAREIPYPERHVQAVSRLQRLFHCPKPHVPCFPRR